jgi:PBP1b-binding outer membrane lipoprotein LpoB
MPTKLKRLAALLLISLLLTACASSRQPSPQVLPPVQIPPPPPELMTIPDLASWPNVPQLLLDWTKRLDGWQARQRLCRDTPQACV